LMARLGRLALARSGSQNLNHIQSKSKPSLSLKFQVRLTNSKLNQPVQLVLPSTEPPSRPLTLTLRLRLLPRALVSPRLPTLRQCCQRRPAFGPPRARRSTPNGSRPACTTDARSSRVTRSARRSTTRRAGHGSRTGRPRRFGPRRSGGRSSSTLLSEP